MKAKIDFSVFSSEVKAFGNIVGEIELSVLAGVGDYLTFDDGQLMQISPKFFSGSLAVESRRFEVGGKGCSLMLQDIIVDGEDEAEALMAGFERAYGFKGYRY
jgi:hypothetical protein